MVICIQQFLKELAKNVNFANVYTHIGTVLT